MDDEKRAFIKDLLVKIAIGLLAALVVSLITIGVPKLKEAAIETIEIFTTGFNLVVVLLFCLVSLNVPRLEFAGPFLPRPSEEKILRRVNKLMKQLNTNILFYAFCLIIVYAIYCASAYFKLPPDFVEKYTNLFNFASSLFVYLSFKVLYDRTLDEHNDPNYYYMDALIFAMIGIGTYSLVTDPGIVRVDVETIAIIKKNFSLIIGILNSLAMGLLFARFISMENVLTNIFEANDKGEPKRNQKILIKNSMIFLLPLYAAVQPIFGNFNLETAMGPSEIHRNIVFSICFVGKTFFLAIYFYYAQRRWIHLYLYSMLNRQGIYHALKNKFALKETYWDDSIAHSDDRDSSRGSGGDLTQTG